MWEVAGKAKLLEITWVLNGYNYRALNTIAFLLPRLCPLHHPPSQGWWRGFDYLKYRSVRWPTRYLTGGLFSVSLSRVIPAPQTKKPSHSRDSERPRPLLDMNRHDPHNDHQLPLMPQRGWE